MPRGKGLIGTTGLTASFLISTYISLTTPSYAQALEEQTAEVLPDTAEKTIEDVLTDKQMDTLRTDTSTNENPDAVRRAERQADIEVGITPERAPWEFDLYGSVRLHGINHFDAESDSRSFELGDGESRLGASLDWLFAKEWHLFARVEAGFDVLDTFTAGSGDDEGGIFVPRLHKIGIDSNHYSLSYGKSWSTYYTVAGAADRFAIFGGEAVGLYNADTDGGATGTGRADNAVQGEIFLDFSPWLPLKPFNLNVQYQHGEPIPKVNNAHYGSVWSVSTWLEGSNSLGIGIAHHQANIDDNLSLNLREAGIDGDATTTAIAVKTSGDRWLVSLVVNTMDNLETTDQNKYINGRGSELFAQWEYVNNWWLVGGGNWLLPDEDDPDAGEYELKYGVVGLRYTFDAF
ncbi:MAG: porin, partial [Halioglobus sp.]